MPLAKNVRDMIDRATRLADGQSIRLIRATLGELTGLTPAEVQAEFLRRRDKTPAAGAKLVLHLEPGRAICLTCEQPVPVDKAGQACEACGSYRRRVVAGQLLTVEAVSVDRSLTATRLAIRPRASGLVPRAPARRVSSAGRSAEGGWDE